MRDYVDLIKIDHKFSSDMLTIESAMKVADIMIFESYTTGGEYEVLTETSIKEVLDNIWKAFLKFLKSIGDWFKKMWAKLTGKKKDTAEEIKEFKDTYIEGKKGPLLIPAPQSGGSTTTSSDDEKPEAPKMIEFKGDVIEKVKPEPKKHKGIIIKTRLKDKVVHPVSYFIKEFEKSLGIIDELLKFLSAGPSKWRTINEDDVENGLTDMTRLNGSISYFPKDEDRAKRMGTLIGIYPEVREFEVTNSTPMVHTAKMHILSYDKDVEMTSKMFERVQSYIDRVTQTTNQAMKKVDKKIKDPEIARYVRVIVNRLKKVIVGMSATAARLHSLVIERAQLSKSFLLAYIKEIGIRAGYDPSKRMPKLESLDFIDNFINNLY